MHRRFIFLFLLVSSVGLAQDVTWFKGSVVLADSDVIVGEISIQTSELILFRTSQQATVYPAHKIQSLRYYDEPTNINRKFISLGDVESGFHQRRLYEVVALGKFTILRKQKDSLLKAYASTDAMDFDYFVEAENKLMNLSQFRKKLYPYLLADSDILQQFIKAERLDANNLADAIRIVIFYNKIITAPTLASLQR